MQYVSYAVCYCSMQKFHTKNCKCKYIFKKNRGHMILKLCLGCIFLVMEDI